MKANRNIIVLLSIVLILLVTIQSLRYTLVYTWYYLNIERITERYCVNKDHPELMCNGKCYILSVLDNTSPEKHQGSIWVFPNPWEFHIYLVLNVDLIFGVTSNSNPGTSSFMYNIYSYLRINQIFHPPQ